MPATSPANVIGNAIVEFLLEMGTENFLTVALA